MKSYTDLSQSKKLAEILPLESADMHWQYIEEDNGQLQWFYFPKDFSINQHNNIPCWSLAALIDVLDRGASFKTSQGWACQAYIGSKAITSNYHSNPVDACVEMIKKLHELKLL